ncbi:MAG TPA: fuculose phosphate aldolase [Chloroflexi bacterium]|nr:fuculose phosphate aldolase [Chloroflexota bacterium]
MRLLHERQQVLDYCRKMIDHKLTTGSGGNISIYNREEGLIAISPGSMDYFKINPEDIMVVSPQGAVVEGKNKPSSEMQFHLALFQQRMDVNAVIHSHSVYATAMACLRKPIPPLHYLVGLIGDCVPVIEYATFGTGELAENIAKGIGTYNAALLANHGVVSVGSDIDLCFIIAEHVELLAQMYLFASAAGSPVLLPAEEMTVLQDKFQQYIFKTKDVK